MLIRFRCFSLVNKVMQMLNVLYIILSALWIALFQMVSRLCSKILVRRTWTLCNPLRKFVCGPIVSYHFFTGPVVGEKRVILM